VQSLSSKEEGYDEEGYHYPLGLVVDTNGENRKSSQLFLTCVLFFYK
jgi:hypothetical protein